MVPLWLQVGPYSQNVNNKGLLNMVYFSSKRNAMAIVMDNNVKSIKWENLKGIGKLFHINCFNVFKLYTNYYQ